MQAVDTPRHLRSFRMDDRRQRLLVTGDGGSESLGFIGWEVEDAAALDRLAARLDGAGVHVAPGSAALAAERQVGGLLVFHDPAGNRMEAFHGAVVASDPFRPGRPISGFRTGPLGMGHVVLHVDRIDAMLPFYRDLLGFAVTDFGRKPVGLCFFHLNGRHHSFTIVESGRVGLHHFMVELMSLDDVGQGYDLAQLQPNRIAYTLGRHSNDHMTSFYTHTPSGFFVEYGWAGRVIDPATWQPHETFEGPSLWGHDRLYMTVEERGRFREMRLAAARGGSRAPVVLPDCPWLDAEIVSE